MATAGLVFHVINRAAKRSVLFETDDDYHAFERLLLEATRRFAIAVFAYCIMPNHWHFVLSPLADGELSRFMHWLTTTHARRWQIAHGMDGQGAVYQGRFRAIAIGGERHFLWVCRYVERNALRANLVNRAEEWRWSSLGGQRDVHDRFLAAWPVPTPADWLDQVNIPQTDGELEAFRLSLATGEPFADPPTCAVLREQLGIIRKRFHARMTPDPITDSYM